MKKRERTRKSFTEIMTTPPHLYIWYIKIYYVNNNHKRAAVAILIMNKIDFKTTTKKMLLERKWNIL